jgi:hypothetical protein
MVVGGGVGDAVAAGVAAARDRAGQRLAVALEHQPGDPVVGAEVAGDLHGDLGVGGREGGRLGVDAALEHAGPVIQALAAGLLRETDLVGLGDVVTGRHSGRRAPDDVVFYNSVGLGVQDAAAAWAIVERAGRLGMGRRVSL